MNARASKGDRWFREGLPFRCLGAECGDCCSGRWGSGYIWVSPEEIAALAHHLGLGLEEFVGRCVLRSGMRYSLVEKPDLSCILYEEGRGCTAYEVRPAQCRAYPFWPEVLESRATWEAEKPCCPGIEAGEEEDLRVDAATIERLVEEKLRAKG